MLPSLHMHEDQAHTACCYLHVTLSASNGSDKICLVVQAVFRHRRERLLRACRAYMTGTARVGAYSEAGASSSTADGAAKDVSQQQQDPEKGEGAQQVAAVTTQGFQLVFKGVFPRLERELGAL